LSERRYFARDAGEAKIKLAATHWRLAGVTFRPKLQDDPIAES
jgi:hypothetical protein